MVSQPSSPEAGQQPLQCPLCYEAFHDGECEQVALGIGIAARDRAIERLQRCLSDVYMMNNSGNPRKTKKRIRTRIEDCLKRGK